MALRVPKAASLAIAEFRDVTTQAPGQSSEAVGHGPAGTGWGPAGTGRDQGGTGQGRDGDGVGALAPTLSGCSRQLVGKPRLRSLAGPASRGDRAMAAARGQQRPQARGTGARGKGRKPWGPGAHAPRLRGGRASLRGREVSPCASPAPSPPACASPSASPSPSSPASPSASASSPTRPVQWLPGTRPLWHQAGS